MFSPPDFPPEFIFASSGFSSPSFSVELVVDVDGGVAEVVIVVIVVIGVVVVVAAVIAVVVIVVAAFDFFSILLPLFSC